MVNICSNEGFDDSKAMALMRNLPGMAYKLVNDGNWSVEYVSPGCRELFGDKPYELIRQKRAVFANLIREETCGDVVDRMDEALRKKEPYKLVYRITSVNESEKWVWDQGEGIYSVEGQLVGAVGFITDFTAHKGMEERLRQEIESLKYSAPLDDPFPEIVGRSPAMEKTCQMILQCAASNANVVVTGESGTGKELVSHAIHRRSDRKDGPFIPVNCGAIPETLMETEFFGCCRGAFSGAVTSRNGLLDRADGGTLFLDEIGEIPLSMQTKLLRAIEGGGYTAVGGVKLKIPDIRIIAATNRDLQALVEQGAMREDFYYRIHVINLRIPPLREREGDVPVLMRHFIRENGISESPGRAEILRMEQYPWPGNVRELQNVLNRYAVMKQLDLPGTAEGYGIHEHGGESDLKGLLKAYEKKIVLAAFQANDFNRTKTAAALGIDRRSLFTRLKEHGIEGHSHGRQ